MIKNLLITICVMFFVSVPAQEYVFGKILSEDGVELGGVVVINMRTEEKTVSDKDGIFMLRAKQNDEIRFVKNRFQRLEKKVGQADYSSSMRIVLVQAPELIEEVEIGFVPSGNIKKDIAKLEPPARVKQLNENMSAYMKTKPAETMPQLQQPSTLSLGPNYSAGQVNVLGLLSFFAKKLQKQPVTPNYAEQQAFYRQVKEEINMNDYTRYGLDEFEFEQLLVFADRKYSLTQNFRTNFSIAAIDSYLKMALKDFLNTRPAPKKQDSIKS